MPTKEKEQVICGDCSVVIPDGEQAQIGRYTYCTDCTRVCDDCGERESTSDSWETYDSRIICSPCRERSYRWCEGCDNLYHENNFPSYSGYCSECDENEASIPWRSWKNCAALTDGAAGKVMKSTRLFGVELETTEKTSSQAVEAINLMHASTGICEDSGIEFQTPPASGNKAEEVINTMCMALNKHQFRVGNGQGLHVHVNASELKTMTEQDRFERIHALWLFYVVFDNVFHTFINNYRRRNSGMCKKNPFKFEEIAVCTNQNELEQVWYSMSDADAIKEAKGYMKDGTRYHGFNLHTLFHAYHPEIRYHEATLSAREILEWANLHCTIMDKAIAGKIKLDWLLKMKDRKMKRSAMFDFLGLTIESRIHFTKTALKKKQ